jgi:GxxExxY protein
VDLIVAEAVVVKLKTVDRLAPVHDAQLHTCTWVVKLGLPINFNVAVLGLEE